MELDNGSREQDIGTLESVIDVGQGISVGPGRFGKKINVGPWINVGPGKFRKKNNRRAGKIWQKE